MILDILKHAIMITGFVAVMMLVVKYLIILSEGLWQKRLGRSPWGQYLLAACAFTEFLVDNGSNLIVRN